MNETDFKSKRLMKIFQSGFQLFISRKYEMKSMNINLLGREHKMSEEEEDTGEAGQDIHNEGNRAANPVKRCPVCHRDWPEEMQWPPTNLRFEDTVKQRKYQDNNENTLN